MSIEEIQPSLVCIFQIFTDRPAGEVPSDRLHPDTVIDYLNPVRYAKAVILYLEHLVIHRQINVRPIDP